MVNPRQRSAALESAATPTNVVKERHRVRRRLLWILLLALLAVTIGLIALHGGYDLKPGASFKLPDFSSSIADIAIIVFVVGMLLTAFRWRLSEALEAAMLWLVVVAFILVGYTYRREVGEVGDRVLVQIWPGYVASRGNEVELARGHGGEFPVTTRVNGARVAMILDTGASAVMLTQDAARAAGLPIEVLSYTVNLETANGRTKAAPVTIDRLAIGNIVERSVPALIVPNTQLKTNLLGMTFLNRLESWQVKGDRLVMRAYP
jgi:aspartyl protease family protein